MLTYLQTELNQFEQPVGQSVSCHTAQFSVKELVGLNVRLLPVMGGSVLDDRDALRGLWQVVNSEPDARCWTYLAYAGFQSVEQLNTALSQGFNFAGSIHYLIEVEGRWLGWVALLNIRGQNRVLEIGNVYFSHAMKKTKAATEVMYLLLQASFAQGFRRVEWKCDAFNEPSIRAAKRFGFQYEGTFRQDRIAKGRNRNTAWFSILDEEWEHLQAAYQAWLRADNFDEHGQQKSSLADWIANTANT